MNVAMVHLVHVPGSEQAALRASNFEVSALVPLRKAEAIIIVAGPGPVTIPQEVRCKQVPRFLFRTLAE